MVVFGLALILVIVLIVVYFVYTRSGDKVVVATDAGDVTVPGSVVASAGTIVATQSATLPADATATATAATATTVTTTTPVAVVAPAAIVGSDGYMRIVSKNGKIALFNAPGKQITAVSVDAAGCASGTTKDGCLWKVNEHGFTVSKANPTKSLTSYGGVTLNTACDATATNLNPKCKVALYPDGRLTNAFQAKTGGAFAKAVGDLVATDDRCKEVGFDAEGCTWELKQ
jgi:hypothetical protein